MNRPMTARVQAIVRDGGCAVCGRQAGVGPQHRNGRGMGGDPTNRLETLSCLMGMCNVTNQRLEADLQALALLCGWKVPRKIPAALVPVWLPTWRMWVRLDDDGMRYPLTEDEASHMHDDAYGATLTYLDRLRDLTGPGEPHPLDWMCTHER